MVEDEMSGALPESAREKYRECLSVLRKASFDLELSERVEDHAKPQIVRFLEDDPHTKLQPETIVGVFLHASADFLGEFKSMRTVAQSVGVSLRWFSKRYKEILQETKIR